MVYYLLVLLIGLVSAYDNVCTFLYRDSIKMMERNPAGLALIHADHGHVSLFMTVKAVTTLACVMILCGFCATKKFRSVVVALTAFQLGLFCYLNWYPQLRPNDGVDPVYVDVLDFYEIRGLKDETPEQRFDRLALADTVR